MKVAICYAGELRTFNHCIRNHEKIFNDCDVYLSTWDRFGYRERINDDLHKKIEDRCDGSVTDMYVINLFNDSSLNLKCFEIEEHSSYRIPFSLKKDDHLWYQYYKMAKCMNMVNLSDYDYIVRLRSDITIEGVAFHHDAIVVNKYHWINAEYDRTNCNEMVFTMPVHLAKSVMDVYSDMDRINKKLPKKWIYGESVFAEHLNYLGINIETFNYNFRVWR